MQGILVKVDYIDFSNRPTHLALFLIHYLLYFLLYTLYFVTRLKRDYNVLGLNVSPLQNKSATLSINGLLMFISKFYEKSFCMYIRIIAGPRSRPTLRNCTLTLKSYNTQHQLAVRQSSTTSFIRTNFVSIVC